MVRKIMVLLSVFFIFWGYREVKAITVDGDASDWTGTAGAEDNSAVVSNDEWIWRDKENDERKNDTYSETSEISASCDITEVRITADTANLYFLVKFRKLELGTTGVSYPLVQVAIDYNKSGGQSIFVNVAQTGTSVSDMAEVSDDSKWEYLVSAFQNDIAVLNTEGSYVTGQGNYSQYVSTNSTGPYFMEFEVPFANIGGSANYLEKTVTFTVASFFHAAAWTEGNLHDVRTFEEGLSNIIDCISLIDDLKTTQESDGSSHNGSAGTWEEVRDNVVDTYFDVKFDASGNVVDNNVPLIAVPTFKVDDIEDNQEVIVESRVPLFSWSWTFSDSDSGDTQKAAQIQLDVDNVSTNGNEIWTSSPVLDANEMQYKGATVLEDNQTYYWRARVMDNHGGWGSWVEAGSFSTVKQAIPFNITKNNLSIDWNNPFNPAKGDYTKVRYIVEQDKHVVIRIYNINGELIKTLVDDDKLNNVVYTEIWDGRDEDNDLVASGVYFVNMKVGTFTKTKKVVVLK